MRQANVVRVVTAVYIALAVIAVGLTAATAILGPENLLLYTLKDDGFYFLKLAENIARGHGASFDGLGPTNGFHPLWALLLTPIFFLRYAAPETPIRLQLLLAVGLHLGAGWVVFRTARELASREAARLTALAYIASPLVLYLVVSGMESPLVGLLVALLTREAIRWRRDRESRQSRAAAIRLGLLCGLCCLARTDLVILSGLCLVGAAVRVVRGATTGRLRIRLTPGRVLFPAAVAAVVVSPWIAWNLVRFGSLVQVSASVHHLHAVSTRVPGEPAGIGRFLHVGEILVAGLFQTIARRSGLPLIAVITLAAAVLLFLVFWPLTLLRDRRIPRGALQGLNWCLAPLTYAVLFLLATFFFLGHIRSWYAAGPLTVGAILLALPAEFAVSRTFPASTRWSAAIIFLGLTVGLLPLGRGFVRAIRNNAHTVHCWQEAADWVVAHTGPDERVASFNSGTFGYLTPRTVVNLDCVVNNRALPYLKRRELLLFLHQNRIHYLIDSPAYVRRYFRAYAKPSWEETIVPVDTLRTGLVVYRVEP